MKKRRIAAALLAGAMLMSTTAPAFAGNDTSSVDYTLTIPSTLTVSDKGWNALNGGIKASAENFDSTKKLTVTASSTNNFKLKSGNNEVSYTLKNSNDDSSATTSWEFDSGDLSGNGKTINAGIDVEDYSSKPAGTYQDTVTFTASVGSASVPVTAITLNKTATTISAGQTETLSVSSVTPDDATDQTVTWSSDNEAVATVDADGKVTAVALGTANITATANDGSGVTATCVVTVNKVVTINQSDWGGWSSSFTKDGVTVSAGMIDPDDGNLMDGGTFSTTLGNFTKIVVTTASCYASGTGWSGSRSSMTWTGTPASTVSFSGEFMGMGRTQTTIVCTIVPKN